MTKREVEKLFTQLNEAADNIMSSMKKVMVKRDVEKLKKRMKKLQKLEEKYVKKYGESI
jgi:DNA repair ATPase RecN